MKRRLTYEDHQQCAMHLAALRDDRAQALYYPPAKERCCPSPPRRKRRRKFTYQEHQQCAAHLVIIQREIKSLEIMLHNAKLSLQSPWMTLFDASQWIRTTLEFELASVDGNDNRSEALYFEERWKEREKRVEQLLTEGYL